MQNLFHHLRDPQDSEFYGAWKHFLYNVQAVQALTEELKDHPEGFAEILTAGLLWEGQGCSTGHCSRELYKTCGVTLVTGNFKEYLNAFLYSLTLHWALEVQSLTLDGQAAQAAFLLQGLYCQQANQDMQIDDDKASGNQSEDENEMFFPWEEETVGLPKELAVLLERALSGSSRLNIKTLLEQLPRFAEVPQRPKVNNYRNAGASQLDKSIKVAQQHLLHSLRLQAVLYGLERETPEGQSAEETKETRRILALQLFQLTADAYAKAEQERKEFVLPGCTAAVEDNLFNQEDLKAIRQKVNVNRVYAPSMFGLQNRGKQPLTHTFRALNFSSFPTERWTPNKFQWQPGKFGKSKGKFGFAGRFAGFGGRGRGKGMAPLTISSSILFPTQATSNARPGRPQIAMPGRHSRRQISSMPGWHSRNQSSSKRDISEGKTSRYIRTFRDWQVSQQLPHSEKGSSSTLPESTAVSDMVEKSTCTTKNTSTHCRWSREKLVRPPCPSYRGKDLRGT